MLQRGDKITRTKLEGLGWYKLFNYGYSCKVFAKENCRIIWDEHTQEITNIYEV